MKIEDQKKICKELGETIREAREKANLTQAEVAISAGVDINYYARIERGVANPSWVKLHSILMVLKMDSLRIK